MNNLEITYLDKILHEINGSVTSIHLLSDLMLNKVKPNKESGIENLRNIYESSNKLGKMVNLLSTITNLKSNKIKIQSNRCNLIEIIKQEINYYQARIRNSSLILKFQNRTPSCYSMIDDFWFKQLLGILITNAMNHTERGVIKVRIGIIEEVRTKYFSLRVSDEGSGIPESELDSIFLPLQRGSHSVDKIPGSGIGLTIAQEIVEAHDGNIVALNNTKAGAVFLIKIPLKE